MWMLLTILVKFWYVKGQQLLEQSDHYSNKHRLKGLGQQIEFKYLD
jgi:hypothetical protein